MTNTPAAPEAPAKFGWCLTGHHGNCPEHLTSSQTRTRHECGCRCHHRKANS